MSKKEECEHVLNHEETHCTICMKSTWQIADEDGKDRLTKLEKEVVSNEWISKVNKELSELDKRLQLSVAHRILLREVLRKHYKQVIENNKRHIEILRDKYGDDDDWELYVSEQERVIEQKKGLLKMLGSEKPLSCDKCDLYGECDHQGAYKKNGKWCYEPIDSKPPSYEEYLMMHEFDKNGICKKCGGVSWDISFTPCKSKENPSEQDVMELRGWEQQNQLDHEVSELRELEKEPTIASSASHTEYKENTWVLIKTDGRTEIYGAKYFTLVRTEDLEWLWKHACNDEDAETLEEYTKKMIELEKFLAVKKP